MVLARATTKEEFDIIESLYEESFPFEEKKPFNMIMKYNGKTFEVIMIKGENGEFLGFLILLKYNQLILVDYFAMAKEIRNRGFGSRVLELLFEQYGGNKIFLEIESTEIPSENLLERIKRKNFYMKNGFEKLPFNIDLFGIEMEILSYKCDISLEEYMDLYLNQYNGEMREKIKNNVRLAGS